MRILAFIFCLFSLHGSALADSLDTQFNHFLNQKVVPEALAAGISQTTLDRELKGLRPDTKLPGLVGPGGKGKAPKINFQAEFSSPAKYLGRNAFSGLVAPGRRLIQKHSATLQTLEKRYGVPKEIMTAIWARESGYGRAKIPYDAIRVLATRAFMGQRTDFFKKELIAALQILNRGDIPRSAMKSSWGGALGQPQFLPTNYLKYAVDFDRNGKTDIWRSEIDVLASIAHFLSAHGWARGRDWGYEARIPDSVSCSREGPDMRQKIVLWEAEGVTRANGKKFPQHEKQQAGNLLMPAGRYGPGFIATENFYVLKEYNESDVYALFVGHLADRYGNNKSFLAPWKSTRKTTRGAVRSLQQALEKKGYDVGGADGLIGYKTRRSIGKDQEANGFFATCWPG